MACTIDFRNLDEGFGGKTYKRKRESQNSFTVSDASSAPAAVMEIDLNQPAKRQAVSASDNPDKPTFGRPSYDGVIAGKVSGRNWKTVRTKRASARHVSKKGKPYEEREKEKELKRAFRERKEELKEEIRKNKERKRKMREEREKKKQENILKSGTKFQKITNPATLKRIAKSKDKKLLRVVPDELVNNRNKK